MDVEKEAPFSERHGYRSPVAIREGAPDWLRSQVLEIARELGLEDSRARRVACRVLLRPPNPFSHSKLNDTVHMLDVCDWYGVYDVAEAIYAEMDDPLDDLDMRLDARRYERALNAVLRAGGVGWQMRGGKIVVRGSEGFEAATWEAKETLTRHGRPTAAREIHEALQDLSRRPEPDLSGAVTHAIAALECVARDVSGNSDRLGPLLKRQAAVLGLPPPLDDALTKLWGYASEQGRHLREGRGPGFEEAELVVGIAAAVSVYLSKKAGG